MTDSNDSASAKNTPAASSGADLSRQALADPGHRVAAALIDGAFIIPAWILAMIPIVGEYILGPLATLAAVAYFFTRDALPFLDGQSIGKRVMKIRVISTETGKPITNDYASCVVRNVIFLIPILSHIYETYLIFTKPDRIRLGDEWADTKVVVDSSQ